MSDSVNMECLKSASHEQGIWGLRCHVAVASSEGAEAEASRVKGPHVKKNVVEERSRSGKISRSAVLFIGMM